MGADERLRAQDTRSLVRMQVSITSGIFKCKATYDPVGVPWLDDKTAGTYVTVRTPLPDCFDPTQLQHWLQECDADHSHKSTKGTSTTLQRLLTEHRFRVVDVYSGAVVTLTTPQRYLALSYVWGQAMAHYAAATPPADDNDNKSHSLLSPVNWDKVPRTIRDAARVVRAINERYLWVDALCIVQSDPLDKQIIVSEMSAVYTNSYLTIIAADGDDAEAGLSRLETCSHKREEPQILTFPDQNVSLLPTRESLSTALKSTKWNSRAWTYQEHVLSPRCALFTESEVFFTCGEGLCLETCQVQKRSKRSGTGAGIRRIGLSHKSQTVHDALMTNSQNIQDYIDAVEAYTRRQLTHGGDRLDAFAGISSRFVQDHFEYPRALSGLLLKSFPQGLLWESDCSASDPAIIRIEHNAQKSRYIPSWTWAGWSGAVHIRNVNLYRSFGLEAVPLDGANIVLRPDKSHSWPIWEAWPFEPTPCESFFPGVVTVHLWAKTLGVQVTPSRTGASMYEVRTRQRGASPVRDGTTTPQLREHGPDFLGVFESIPHLVDHIDRPQLLDLLCFGHYKNYGQDRLHRFLLVQRKSLDGAEAERVAVMEPVKRKKVFKRARKSWFDSYVQLQ